MTETLNHRAGDRTLSPADTATKAALDAVPDDPMGRALVRLANVTTIENDTWTPTTDLRTGHTIEVRRTDCGLTCRCAAEVRLAPVPARSPND